MQAFHSANQADGIFGRYLTESKIAQKVSGYTENVEAKQEPANKQSRSAKISSIYKIQVFLLALANSDKDGRVMISSNNGALTLKYQLLNPSDAFADFALARSVVIAGGTMAPLSDFAQQLFTFHGAEQVRNLSCSHVVAQDHILVRAIGIGPTGTRLEFKYESRGDVRMLDEYGSVISNIANLAHKGVVVFMPSYATLDLLLKRWEATGTLAKIRQKKEVYQEPKTGSESEAVLRDFAAAIAGPGVSACVTDSGLH